MLARVGFPLAATVDPALAWGVYLEIADEDELPPRVFVQWRVHPLLRDEFMKVEPARLLDDPKAGEYRFVVQVMNDALVAILRNAGFDARVMTGERIGEILVADPE